MHKANRIGTPNFNIPSTVATPWDQITPAIQTAGLGTGANAFNVVNAVPAHTYLSTPLNMQASAVASYATDRKFGLLQQFTVESKPQSRSIGVELNGCITGLFRSSAVIRPVFLKLEGTAPSTAFQPYTGNEIPMQIGEALQPEPIAAAVWQRTIHWQTQIMLSWITDPAGLYAHGIEVLDQAGGAAVNLGRWQGYFNMRTLDWIDVGAIYDPQQ